ncbi:aminotransferase class IV [Pseudomonadota bacterium]|nr:aminotransferase class IV [Alphaproteobacteria bacterium]MDC1357222.1 aminotransferase class IV [Pseudomonadota bacterium]
MPNIIYINGKYASYEDSKIHVNDRGYHFGDAVYEVIVFNNKIFYDFDGHIQRLFNSLKSLEINFSFSMSSLKLIIKNLIKMNRAIVGSVYIQVSRGISERNHSYYGLNIKPILTIIITKKSNIDINVKGVRAITLDDNRWSRPDIKTTQLLPNVMAKTKAVKNGAYESIFIDSDGYVTEGSSSNIWILNNDNKLITRNLDGKILSGITRNSISSFAKENNINVVEKRFTRDELFEANEVFLTSASSFVIPIIQIDNHKINEGLVGNISLNLRKLYFDNFKS